MKSKRNYSFSSQQYSIASPRVARSKIHPKRAKNPLEMSESTHLDEGRPSVIKMDETGEILMKIM
jgi:hypothetical protein